jgi:transposase
MKVVAGIDVGKSSLDVSVSAGPVRRFDNAPAGLSALVGWLEREGATHVVCESTGGYEREVVRRLRSTAWSVHIAHPNRVRNFARAAGRQAKTDALDAQMLSRYGQVFEVPSSVAAAADSEVLQDLLRRRKQLVDQRVQERHRLDQGRTQGARTSTQRHIGWLDGEIGRLDEEYRKALENSVELSESAALYRSVPGVGELTAATLGGYLPELGQSSGKELTSLVGLAPWSNDSGRQQGYRSIRGGRGTVRRVLYLAALSAIRYNDDLSRFYQGLRQRGKTGKVAVVAVMRKLLLLLNAIAHRGTPWVEHHAPAG